MRKNKRKIEALQLLRNLPNPHTSADIALFLDISRNSASNLLRRLWRQGLAGREKKDKRLRYWLKKKGLKRLEYLEKQRFKGGFGVTT